MPLSPMLTAPPLRTRCFAMVPVRPPRPLRVPFQLHLAGRGHLLLCPVAAAVAPSRRRASEPGPRGPLCCGGSQAGGVRGVRHKYRNNAATMSRARAPPSSLFLIFSLFRRRHETFCPLLSRPPPPVPPFPFLFWIL